MGLLDNQKLQTGVATLLGVDDESDQANVIARQWASDNDYSDSEEDTLRHILLGGFMQSVEGEGLGRLGKGIAGKLINVRESTDEESLIDVDNNNFGRQLRKELINRDKDSSVEGFVEAAKNFVHNLRTEKEVRDVDGLRPRMSTAGQEKQIDMAKGGAIPMNNQMQQFAEGGLKDEGGEIDEVSGNEVPIGGTKEGVRDDIPANVSEGEFVMPADVVRYHGLDKMMQIRQEAKMGLKKMEAMGQMGNSDEATMDDDMPFGMADLMVVSSNDEPMEFADGGFIPVKDYTEVQSMISDKAQKGAGYANGGSVESYTDYQGQPLVNSPVNLTGQNTLTQDVRDAAILDPDPNYQPSMEELETVDVPMTGDSTEEIDYDLYMGSVTTVTKEYRNAAGESVVITFINGVPTLPIPEGYTLYDPSVAPTGGGVGVATAGTAVVNTFNSNNNDNDNNNQSTVEIEKIDYAGMSNEEFATRMEYENTAGYQFGQMVGTAIASIVPFGGALMYAARRSHARKSEQRLNNLIANAKTPEEKARYTAILSTVLKNARLKSAEESGVFAKWVDGYLTKNGYTPEEAAAAAAFVAEAGSVNINTTTKTPQDEANVVNEINNIAKKFGMTDTQAALVISEANSFSKSLDTDSGKTAESTNVFATMMQKLNLTDEEREVARKKLVGKEISTYISGIKNKDTKDTLREQVSGLAPTGDTLVQAPQRQTRDMSQTKAAFGEAVGATPKSVADSSRMLAINEPAKPTGPIGTPDTQGDTGRSFYDTYAKTLSPDGDRTDASTNFLANTSIRNIGETSQPETIGKAADYYRTGAGSKGATSGVSYDPQAQQKGMGNQFTNEESGLDKLAKKTVTKDPRNLGGSEGYGPTQQQTQTVFGEDYTPTSAELNKQLAASGQTNLTTVPTSVADSSRMLAINEPLGGGQQETFNQAFNRNRLAGAKVFTHTDGKKYTTQTVEERKAQQAVPTGENSAFQNAANALTKNDGRSYVGGVLLDDKTKQPYVKPPSDIADNYGGDIYGPLKDTNRGRTVEDASSGANVVNRTGAPIAKANQKELAKRLGDPGKGMVWGVQPGTNTLTKIGISRIGIKKDGTKVSSSSSSSGDKNNNKSSGSTKTYSSLAAAARDGQHGKAVTIEGKGLQKVAFGNKTYDAKMKKASDNSKSSNTSGSGSNRSTAAVNTASTGRTTAQIQADINKEVGGGKPWTAKATALVKERDSAKKNDGGGNKKSGGGGGGGGCCFIMLEARYGNGTMDEVVRRYRDEYMTQRNRRGYYKLAEVLVPLMRKSKVFKWVVTKTFADPLVAYGKYYYGQNKYGVLYSPIKSFWMKVFDVLGGKTEFIRENGEVV